MLMTPRHEDQQNQPDRRARHQQVIRSSEAGVTVREHLSAHSIYSSRLAVEPGVTGLEFHRAMIARNLIKVASERDVMADRAARPQAAKGGGREGRALRRLA